jgi:hypothetical protein
MNSEGIPLPQFSAFPPPVIQAQVYQQFLPQQVPVRSLPNSRNTIEDLITLNRADVARRFLEGQIDTEVAGMLIETPKFLNLHKDNPTLHSSGRAGKKQER